jgi:NTP pyrophosphatase (non-canonical NTP hydrolase)
MNWDEYQSFVVTSKKYDSSFAILYPVLGLASEAGEVAGKLKKTLRDFNGKIDEEQRNKLIDEISDVLWYVTACVDDLGFTLEELAEYNYTKISGRLRNGTIHGDGDVR